VREHEAAEAQSAADQQVRSAPAAATAVDVVAGWQRSLGNKAVARILSRQDELDGPPTRIDRDDPLIQTVRGPIFGERGVYRWLVRFQLPFAATADGWLIQELYQDGHEGALDHFWECWRIRQGNRSPEDPTEEEGVFYDDRYVFGRGGATPDETGWHRHVGVIRFYPGPLPPQFGADSGANSYLTRTQPSGWTDLGTRHDAYSEWDYRAGHTRVNGFVAYAGTRELRAGDTVTFRPRAAGAVPRRL
jgi:hypothetical protein